MVELYLHLQMGSTLYEIYEPVSKLLILGMVIPPLMTGILIVGISTPNQGLMTIPYYRELWGV